MSIPYQQGKVAALQTLGFYKRAGWPFGGSKATPMPSTQAGVAPARPGAPPPQRITPTPKQPAQAPILAGKSQQAKDLRNEGVFGL